MRFTIRDVLWLTVVFALALGWWIDRTRQVARYDRLMYAVEGGGPIFLDSSGELHPSYRYPTRRDPPKPAPLNRP